MSEPKEQAVKQEIWSIAESMNEARENSSAEVITIKVPKAFESVSETPWPLCNTPLYDQNSCLTPGKCWNVAYLLYEQRLFGSWSVLMLCLLVVKIKTFAP